MSTAEKLNKMRQALEEIRDTVYEAGTPCKAKLADLRAKAFITLYEIDNNIKDE